MQKPGREVRMGMATRSAEEGRRARAALVEWHPRSRLPVRRPCPGSGEEVWALRGKRGPKLERGSEGGSVGRAVWQVGRAGLPG